MEKRKRKREEWILEPGRRGSTHNKMKKTLRRSRSLELQNMRPATRDDGLEQDGQMGAFHWRRQRETRGGEESRESQGGSEREGVESYLGGRLEKVW